MGFEAGVHEEDRMSLEQWSVKTESLEQGL